jgi:hypothetical protein
VQWANRWLVSSLSWPHILHFGSLNTVGLVRWLWYL